MSNNHSATGRRKFDVSLAQLTRPGVQSYHFKNYKPSDMGLDPSHKSQTESEVLTPQQEARKRYEEKNIVQRRQKARERMAKRRAQNPGKERETQKAYEEKYRQKHREERRYQEDHRRSLRYIENYGAKSFHLYLRRRNGCLQRPEDYVEPV
ncbi:hypothetical protein EV361DRAFT_873588 [Lentinula raphanica]|uniref:Uncharacterized protein n=1 Tax=Lentinula raphanica TaxID=153919 RepID=A0AA38NYM5_9AGAR|nr:hypothetical protein F5878DRAFT_646260 [Lentinula raphanica]KAJ3964966.1 hypothetical protein EV361DRAFT_873588 [Lentinula raphanica]